MLAFMIGEWYPQTFFQVKPIIVQNEPVSPEEDYYG